MWESLGMKKFSFTMDPARVNDEFATDSDGNLLRVIAHSQAHEKINSKDL
jgi:hypothetical protein